MDEFDALFGGSLDPFAGLGLPRKSKARVKPLPEAEQKSVMREVLNKGTGGLQWLGETLDKPGRAARGLLAGRPGEIANLIPFSDTMGLTDPSQSVSGRDLLEQAGLAGPNQVGRLDAGDVAGFGAEILLDPTTYLTFGASAVGKAGKVAKAAGLSTKGAARYRTLGRALADSTPDVLKAAGEAAAKHGTTLEALAGQKLGGLFGVKVPFGPSFVPGFAQGETAQAIGEGLGQAARLPLTLAARNPKIRKAMETTKAYWRGAFDPAVQNQFDPLAQELASVGTKNLDASRDKLLQHFAELGDEMKGLTGEFVTAHGKDPFFAHGVDPAEIVRRAVQHGGETAASPGAFSLISGGALNVAPELENRISAFGKKLSDAQAEAFSRYQAGGGDVNALNEGEFFRHLFRQPAEAASRPSGLKLRTQAPKYVPAEQINAMLRDPSLLYADKAAGAKADLSVIAERLLGPAHLPIVQQAADLAGKPVQSVASDLAEWLSSKGTKFAKEGKNYYGNDVLRNHFDYMASLNRMLSNMDAVKSLLGKSATNDLEGTVRISEALAGAKMNPGSAIAKMASEMGTTPEALRNMRIPQEVADAASSVLRKQTNPEWMDKIGQLIDKAIGAYKSNLTVPFPSFHVRNRASGMWMNLASNHVETPADLMRYGQASAEMTSILKNPQANAGILQEMVAHRALPVSFGQRGSGEIADVISGALPEKGTSYLSPLGPARYALDSAKAGVSGYQKARAAGSGRVWSSVKGAYNALHEPGSEAARQIEAMNRGEMYLYLKGKGWAPDAAAAEVRKLQIDYSDLTQFEKKVMKRIVPFYSFTRKNLPVLIEKMLERPGGPMAQTVRGSNIGRSEDDFVPPYVGEGMSVPLPGGDGRYLSELGLPTDQFANLFATGPTGFGTFKRTGQKLLSQIAPPLKAAVELPTGINLFTGKPFEDLYQYPTNSPLTNAFLGETPASRYISAIRTLGDPRKEAGTKAMNLLTGLRVTDVSGGLEKQKEYAAKKILNEMLREEKGIGSFSEVYQKQGAELTPEAERLYRAYRGLVTKQRKEGKAKKKVH